MNVENRVYPDPEQIAELRQPGPEGPIVMVNLIKFRERAEYPDGRDAHLSGREAYHRYGAAFAPLLRAAGGRVVYVGDVTFLMLGRVETPWDEVALAEYPSREAFFAVMSSPAYREITVHRAAGLAGQLNLETTTSAFARTVAGV